MSIPPAITVSALRKAYGQKVVLDGIDLDIPAGSIFALLGPNGAGKTTTVNILSTLVAADGGSALVAGHDPARDPDAVRAAIGVTGQFSAVDGLLTGEENLVLMADLHHLDRAEGRRRARDLLERFDLVDAARKPAATYSGGMRRRLDLAMGLVGRPQVLFLDEPTIGLDPRSRRALWDMIRELAATGVTVLLTTQYLEEADQLADRIAVLDKGRIVAAGTADELKSLVPGGHIRLTFPDAAGFDAAARVLTGALRDDAALALQVASGGTAHEIRDLLDELDRLDVKADRLSVHTPDLDDVFLALTGRPTLPEAISR
jgi:ABC-2 type transport system ATP-binding protein